MERYKRNHILMEKIFNSKTTTEIAHKGMFADVSADRFKAVKAYQAQAIFNIG